MPRDDPSFLGRQGFTLRFGLTLLICVKCWFDCNEINKVDKHTVVSQPRFYAIYVCACACVCMRVCMCVWRERCPPSVVLKSAHRPVYCFTIAAMQVTTKEPRSRTITLEISQTGACFLSRFSTENYDLFLIYTLKTRQDSRNPLKVLRWQGLVHMSCVLKFHNRRAVVECKWAVEGCARLTWSNIRGKTDAKKAGNDSQQMF